MKLFTQFYGSVEIALKIFMSRSVFWDNKTPCSSLKVDKLLEGTCHLNFEGRKTLCLPLFSILFIA
jgi:hypothetical protein